MKKLLALSICLISSPLVHAGDNFYINNNTSIDLIIHTSGHGSNCTNDSEDDFDGATIPAHQKSTFYIDHNDDFSCSFRAWYFTADLTNANDGSYAGRFEWDDVAKSDFTPYYSELVSDNGFVLTDPGIQDNQGILQVTHN